MNEWKYNITVDDIIEIIEKQRDGLKEEAASFTNTFELKGQARYAVNCCEELLCLIKARIFANRNKQRGER